MPAEFLLPLFAVTLLANAILVVAAIRSLRHGQPDVDRPTLGHRPAIGRRPDVPGTAAPPSAMPPASTEDAARPIGSGEAPTVPAVIAPVGDAVTVGDPVTVGDAVTVGDSGQLSGSSPTHGEPSPLPELDDSGASLGSADAAARPASTPSPRRRPPKKVGSAGDNSTDLSTSPGEADSSGTDTAETTRRESRRGRRRFSLPPLDDDHDKVNRSIESFFSGVESAAPDTAPVAADAAPGEATTIALVALEDVPAGHAAGTMRTGPSAAEAEAMIDALGMVERTLRSAARGSDVVTVDDHGHFEIVLRSTGELAARAYLRRIRAAIEPRLQSAERPLRLTVATATALDEPLADAIRRAETRLSAALGVPHPAGDRTTPTEPDARTHDPAVPPRVMGNGTIDHIAPPRAAAD